MEIKIIKEDKRQFMDLLLLGDEQEDMIERYLDRGELFALYNGNLKSIAVVTQEDEDTYEIKNLATVQEEQGKCYGSRLVMYLLTHYQGFGKKMLVGTGEGSRTVGFYEHLGFVRSYVLQDFFTEHYTHPIVEDGMQIRHMVVLVHPL